ncbi:spirocyclase AveC family protein [Pseudofrankia inefficax]|uniref:Postpolyketide modification protein n=1 Tax=Pseudofrankia inefficax (strain DSM 45817 / CECT 9037 / DDB 130130 / EuI1c) TaxID=298654 RepID=E3IVA3_PSEI1|nr:spirocyclase AveC family protein [Pseudofrankia inefficax]ADP81267.1 hypothetical protein FraEuI1c_3254 [Pseudofrankia inefficax]
MSDQSVTSSPPPAEVQRTPGPESENSPPPRNAVRVWSVVGGVLLLVQLYVWIRWVTSPYFARVPQGPSDPPLYMKIPLVVDAAAMWIGLPIAIWHFLVRPWLRERRITLDGMLLASLGLMGFQDPLLNYTNTWCVYNTWLFNRGSWSHFIPGWISPEAPGHQVPAPILTNVPGYTWGVLVLTISLCTAMHRIKNRWPGIGNLRLIGITFVICFLFDVVMEGLVLMPIGFYSYPGAIRSVSLFAGTYHQYPLYEGLMWGGVQTALCCLRFFTDDQGRTIPERGLEAIRGGAVRRQSVRFLAIFAAASACFFVCYNLPAQWIGLHADAWPQDVQKRSYLNGGICGDGTNTPCPDPALPIPTKHSGYVDLNGRFVPPSGVTAPKSAVPFERGK